MYCVQAAGLAEDTDVAYRLRQARMNERNSLVSRPGGRQVETATTVTAIRSQEADRLDPIGSRKDWACAGGSSMSIGDYFSSSAQQRTFGQLQDAESEKITMDNRSFREPAKVAGRNALGGLFGNSGRQLRAPFMNAHTSLALPGSTTS